MHRFYLHKSSSGLAGALPPDTLDRDDLYQIAQLWVSQGVAPKHRPLEILERFFEALCALTDSHTAFAVLTLRDNKSPTLEPDEDPLDGWRAKELVIFRGSAEERMLGMSYKDDFSYAQDQGVVANMKEAGAHRVYLLDEMLPKIGLERGDLHSAALLAELGIEDRLVGMHNLCEGAELSISLDRLEGSPRYTERERDILFEVICGMRSFATRLFMSFGLLPGTAPLTPREQTTLQLLLDGLSEKEAADVMGIQSTSLHQYVVSVYRKLGVNSRPQLLGLWLDPPTDLPLDVHP